MKKRIYRRKGMIIIAICFLLAVYFLLFFHARWRSRPESIVEYETTNPYISQGTMVAAHRIGGGEAPEETMAALKRCLEGERKIEVLEVDLRLSADGVLVLFHDETLDRTTDSPYVYGKKGIRVEDLTLEELKRLNAAASFKREDGTMPYRDLHGESVPEELKIMRVEEFLSVAASFDKVCLIIEIKDKGERGKMALDILYPMLEERGLIERVIIGTFNREISYYAQDRYPLLTRSATVGEALEFYISAIFGRKNYKKRVSVIQVFYGRAYFKYGINFATARVINYAHSHDIAMQYWTVNDERDMEYLISVGADAIITDYVDRALAIRDGV